MTNQKIVGIYVRLSNEDTRSGESSSIENQKLMLTKHTEEMGWKLAKIYVDDGFSGTNQNRPAFQSMIFDVKKGFINTILIKDLSRLGRNYLEVGNLAEVFLPEHGCELVSLSEPLDEMMVFRNWFNEQHSKSTSKKVRAAKRISAESGKYLGPYAPYGFKKDPNNRHRLVIDDVAAPVVRSIFQMRASGMSFRAIAGKLDEDGIIPPKDYYYQNIVGRKNPFVSKGLWSESSVKLILSNETYLGNVVQGKFGTISYKNKKTVRKPSENWIRVQGQHKALIEKDLWDRVQALKKRNYKPRRQNDGERSLFTGLLRCADCHSNMRSLAERGRRKDGSEYNYISYFCGNYAKNGKHTCSAHIIYKDALMELIYSHIHSLIVKTDMDEERVSRTILSDMNNKAVSYQAAYQNELGVHKKQAAKLDLLIESLYEDKVASIMPVSWFIRQAQKYEEDRAEHLKSAEALEKRIEAIKNEENTCSTVAELIDQYKSPKVLDSEILLLLIDAIVVGEAQVVDGKRVKDVKVIYKV